MTKWERFKSWWSAVKALGEQEYVIHLPSRYLPDAHDHRLHINTGQQMIANKKRKKRITKAKR